MDLRSDNPVGRVPDFSRTRRLPARFTPAGWTVGRTRGAWGQAPLAGTLIGLDRFHEVTLTGAVPPAHANEVAEFTRRAIARGTFITRAGLSPTLLGSLPPADPSLRAGDLAWDAAAVAQRRQVLVTAATFPTLTAVLVSKRTDLLTSQVRRIAGMDYPHLEILVGLHGCPEPEGLREAAGSRELSVHAFEEDRVYGEVLQDTFARASGELVTKIDDDDYYSREHLIDLVLAHEYSGATLVGKATTVVYLEALAATVRRVYGRWESFTHRVAGGTMLLSAADLTELGGWPHIPRGVDTGLLQRVAAAGGRTYYPHDIGYLYVREALGDHTWDTDVSHFLRNTREQWVGLYAHPAFGTAEANVR